METTLQIWVLYIGPLILVANLLTGIVLNRRLTKVLRLKHQQLRKALGQPEDFPPSRSLRFGHWVLFRGWRESSDPDLVAAGGNYYLAQYALLIFLLLWVPSLLAYWHLYA